jgi:hypothetical protein
MIGPTDGGRAYLERLELAVDIRLIDDEIKWPSLADRVDEMMGVLEPSDLSAEEHLLYAAARALGGELDDATVREIEAIEEVAGHDLPFVALVLAACGVSTPRAQQRYRDAIDTPTSPTLKLSLRRAFECGFPPSEAGRLDDEVKRKIIACWPDTMWHRTVRLLDGDDRDLMDLVLFDQLPVGVTGRISSLLVSTGKWRDLLTRSAAERPAPQSAAPVSRIQLLAAATAWRVPLPRNEVRAMIGPPPVAASDAATLLALACGDLEAVRDSGDPLSAGTAELTLARGIATLAGPALLVRQLWKAVTSSPETPAVAILLALFKLELNDRAALKELAASLASQRAAAWRKALLARIHLAIGDPAYVETLVGDDEGPVAQLLLARATAATDPAAAIPVLRGLVESHPGWSEARLRLGLALAQVDSGAAIDVLETMPSGGADSAALGPPTTARAAALLAAGELQRRRHRIDVARLRVAEALKCAPGSPLVARQATTLAVALRSGELAADAHRRLQVVAPGAPVVDRLRGGMLELRGELDQAMECYHKAFAWDRIAVLGARRNTVTLPDKLDLEDTASVAALHGIAVAASRAADVALAARALERAVARRPAHTGLRDDLVSAHLHCARAALTSGDLTALLASARDLQATRLRLSDGSGPLEQLQGALAAVVAAICQRWAEAGDGSRARQWLEEIHAETGDARVAAHAAALAIRERRNHDTQRLLATASGDHRTLLSTLAELRSIEPSVNASWNQPLARARARNTLTALRDAADPTIAAAAHLLDIMTGPEDHQARDLAAWCGLTSSDSTGPESQPPRDGRGPGPAVLGADALLYVAATLARVTGAGIPGRSEIASYLETAADHLDGNGARRVRLFALGLRGSDAVPAPLAVEDLDLGRFARAEERRFATALIALEARRRKRVGDAPGAMSALKRLVELVRPETASGGFTVSSTEDAAEAALGRWRSKPADPDAQQGAIATQLRRAVARELAGRTNEDCSTAWTTLIGLIGPVFASDEPWRALAARRNAIYTVPPQDVTKASNACRHRLDSVFAELTRWHAARDGGMGKARIERVQALLDIEISVARSVATLRELRDTELSSAIPTTLGPCGLDLLGLRARAIGALSSLPPGSRASTAAGSVRGILVGELPEPWKALHMGRLDHAEQLIQHADPTEDVLRLRAAICVRRMEDSPNPLRALDIAVHWAPRLAPRSTAARGSAHRTRRISVVHRALVPGNERAADDRAGAEHESMPEDLAIRIVETAQLVYTKYGLGQARRSIQAIRSQHDNHTLREGEAALLRRYLNTHDCDPVERIRRHVEILVLVPGDPARAALHHEVSRALADATTAGPVDEIIAVLAGDGGNAGHFTGELIVEARLRQIDLAAAQSADELDSVPRLEARIAELRRALELARVHRVSPRRVIERLATLHERLAALPDGPGHLPQVEQHRGRAASHHDWLAPSPE